MSILADLLSKVKYQEHKKDVPPGLKRVISNYAGKEAVRKKIIILSILVFLAVITGVGTVYFMELYIKPSTTKTEAKRQEPVALNPQAVDIKEVPKSTVKADSTVSKPKAAKSVPVPKHKHIKKPELQKEAKKEIVEEKTTMLETKSEDDPKIVTAEPKTSPKINSSQKDIYLYTARTYESKKDYHQALLNYKKALEIAPENYIIMNNISSVLLQMGSFEEAIKYSKNALSAKTGYVPSLVNLGIAYIKLGNVSEGEGYLLKALSIEPSNAHALLNLGILHERRGDMDKAYGYFFRLSEMGDIQGRLGIARIWEKQGRVAEAIGIYREIMSINNIDPQIKKFANDRLLQLGQ